MTTEIELKYLLLGDNHQASITEALEQHQIKFSYDQRQLNNCYFDTPDMVLRKLDFGLRTRQSNSHIEQTIKTAGVVIGGLHSRPEYNVELEHNCPELALFPQDIWPQGQDVASLQQHLVKLFTTDFLRHRWIIQDANENVIELVLDQGEINSGEQKEAINEVELELVSGDRQALFLLAKLLFNTLAMRPGMVSKAARGYQLWQHQHISQYQPISFVCTPYTHSIAGAFTQGVEQGLNHLQASIGQYLFSKSLVDLERVKTALAIIRHGFWLFEAHLSSAELQIREELSHFIHLLAWVDNAIYLQELITKKGNYRKKLDYSEQLIEQLKIEKRRFPNQQDISELLHSERFNKLQLAILQLCLQRSKQNEDDVPHVRQELLAFARDKIQLSLAEVSEDMKSLVSLNCEQYIGLSKPLYRSLLTGTWLAGLFDNDLRDKFRRPWLDLQQGISELQTLWIIQQQLAKLTEPPKKLVNWQTSKVEGLLTALDNTKATAIEMTPYWYD